jgi:hypothetical protein
MTTRMILSDTDIINFSNQLNDSRFFIRPEYTNFSSYPVIGYYINSMHQDIRNLGQGYYGNDTQLHGRIPEPEVRYEITFSVCEKRIDEFFDIFNKITENGIENFVYHSTTEHRPIKFTEDIVDSKTELTHTFMNRKYRKIKYSFVGRVSSIIAYVQALKDTIEYFGMIWGYTEEGEELCLLKYPIGSIVSPLNDKSKDVLVVDYDYNKSTNNKFTINYEVYEILSNEKSSTLQYGNKSILPEEELCLSRTAQVNSILN